MDIKNIQHIAREIAQLISEYPEPNGRGVIIEIQSKIRRAALEGMSSMRLYCMPGNIDLKRLYSAVKNDPEIAAELRAFGYTIELINYGTCMYHYFYEISW